MNVKYTKVENRRRKELLAQLRVCEDAAVQTHLEAELTNLRNAALQRTAKRSMERERKRATAPKPKPTAEAIAALSDDALLNRFNCQRDFYQNMDFDNCDLYVMLEYELNKRRIPMAWKIAETDSFVDEHGVSMQNPAGRAYKGIVSESEYQQDVRLFRTWRDNA